MPSKKKSKKPHKITSRRKKQLPETPVEPLPNTTRHPHDELILKKLETISSTKRKIDDFLVNTRSLFAVENYPEQLTNIDLLLKKINSSAKYDNSSLAGIFNAGIIIDEADSGFIKIMSIINDMFDNGMFKKTEINTQIAIQSCLDSIKTEVNDPLSDPCRVEMATQLMSFEFDDISDYAQSNGYMILTLGTYIQLSLNELGVDESGRYIDLLETIKTLSILPTDFVFDKKREQQLQQFGLVPVYENMSISDIAKIFFEKPLKMNEFIQATSTRKLNLLIMNIATKSEYVTNMTHIYQEDKNREAPINIPSVSEKTINRFTFFRKIDSKFNKSKLVKHIHNKGSDWICLRTFDGVSFDVLSNKTVYSGLPITIHKLVISNGTVEKLSRGPSPRIDLLNRNVNKKISNSLRPPYMYADNMPAENMVASKKMASAIVLQLEHVIAAMPISTSAAEFILFGYDVINMVKKELMVVLPKEFNMIPVLSSVRNIKAEFYAISYMSITNISANMAKLLSENVPEDSLFKEFSGETLRSHLVNIIRKITDQAVTFEFTAKGNVYDSLLISDNIFSNI